MIKHVVLIALEQMIATSIALPMEMLTAAININNSFNFNSPKNKQLEIDIVGLSYLPIRSSGQLKIIPEKCFYEIKYADLVIIPALWRHPLLTIKRTQPLFSWLKILHKQGATICAVTTGTFLLAEAGLLDNQPATTHWYYLDMFSKRYTSVLLKRHHLITKANRLFCVGSINSLADLMIYLIKRELGANIAHKVEQQFSPEIRQSADKLLFSKQYNCLHQDEMIVDIQKYLKTYLTSSIDFKDVSSTFFISQRTLNRRFKDATGMTPKEYLLKLRIDCAKELLKKQIYL